MATSPSTPRTGAAESRDPLDLRKPVLGFFAVLTLASVIIFSFLAGYQVAPQPKTTINEEPLSVRAESDARAWLANHVGGVEILQRNAVVFNWTVVPAPVNGRPEPGWQFTEWYVRNPDGSLKIVGFQRLSGLNG